MLREPRYFFLRDRNRVPVACVATQVGPISETLYVGLSVWNPLDTFNRQRAKRIALDRAMRHGQIINVAIPIFKDGLHIRFRKGALTGKNVKQEIMSQIAADKSMPTRARNAAKLWLAGRADASRQYFDPAESNSARAARPDQAEGHGMVIHD